MRTFEFRVRRFDPGPIRVTPPELLRLLVAPPLGQYLRLHCRLQRARPIGIPLGWTTLLERTLRAVQARIRCADAALVLAFRAFWKMARRAAHRLPFVLDVQAEIRQRLLVLRDRLRGRAFAWRY